MAEKRKGYGRLAKRRTKLLGLVPRYLREGDPETADRYIELAAEIKERLRREGVCVACGRPLKNEESLKTGYGPECTDKLEDGTAC